MTGDDVTDLAVCVLASGSSGNCVYVGGGGTHLLIDLGVSCKAAEERLRALGVAPEGIHGICVTHEHDDHRLSLPAFQRRTGVPLYGNAGTIEAIGRAAKFAGMRWETFITGHPFAIGALTIEPFRIPHDAYDPVGFVIAAGPCRIAVCTDLGMPTELIRQRLRDCDVIVLEANHDEDMLRASRRPWPLIQRILGRQGHLSNHKAGELLAEVATPRLHTVLLAHLSRDCNRQELARHTVAEALRRRGVTHVRLVPTHPDRASDLVHARPPATGLAATGLA